MKGSNKRAPLFKAGMYLLDSFTSGMYNEPLIIYREYIQNAVDSIDQSHMTGSFPLEVKILLDPFVRSITIRDNAIGIPADQAQSVLCSIGSSEKSQAGLRGFRGIGRLGGIAFAEKAVFRTKARGERLVSVQEWDCQSLRKLLAGRQGNSLTLEDVFLRITEFHQEKTKDLEESFFEVVLSGVSSFRNQLFDLDRVRRYLSQVAPVPFDPERFSHARQVDEYLSSRLPCYGRYHINLNGEPVFKPYRDAVKITKGEADRIEAIEFFEISNGNVGPLAYGWYGLRRKLLGSIIRGDDSAGMRVRVGNIQIGDAHLLDICFREPRFNSYVPGEVHVVSRELIPNSRRDDFVDNAQKGLFFNGIEREIGLPVSKEIRLRSRQASAHQAVKSDQSGECPLQTAKSKEDLRPSVNPQLPPFAIDSDTKRAHSVPSPNLPTAPMQALPAREPLGQRTPEALLGIFKETCGNCPKLAKLLDGLMLEKS